MKALDAWYEKHQAQAALEGWGIFWFSLFPARVEIQRVDSQDDPDAVQLDDDDQAWAIVLKGTEPRHIEALALIKALDPEEYGRIMKFKEDGGADGAV